LGPLDPAQRRQGDGCAPGDARGEARLLRLVPGAQTEAPRGVTHLRLAQTRIRQWADHPRGQRRPPPRTVILEVVGVRAIDDSNKAGGVGEMAQLGVELVAAV